MKKYTIYYQFKGYGKSKSHGCDNEKDAVNFISKLKLNGHKYSGLKFDGKQASPNLTLRLNRLAERTAQQQQKT